MAEFVEGNSRRIFCRESCLPCARFMQQLQSSDGNIVVFVIATCGQGELPRTMQALWRQLCSKRLNADVSLVGRFGLSAKFVKALASLRYCLFGLGDSQYDKFNFAAKKVHRRLQQIAAKAIQEPTFADEQHDLGRW